MIENLEILVWPDPRLRKVSEPVREFNAELKALAEKMLELMRQSKGVGLAAPQVGHNIRLFVMNGTGEPGNDRFYVNPVLSDPDGEEDGEEGCLSVPEVNVQINRNRALRMQAQDLDGKAFEQVESGYLARIWQHECDHLNGVLIIDRMGLGDRFKHRKRLREMEEAYAKAHPEVKKKSQRGRRGQREKSG